MKTWIRGGGAAIAASILLATMSACSGSKGVGEKPAAASPDNSPAAASAAPDDALGAADSGKSLFLINGTPVDARELRTFIATVHPEDADNAEALTGLVDALINNRLIAARAEAEKLHEKPAVRSQLESRLNRLWRDAYWSAVVKPTLKIPDKALLAKAPAMEEMVSLQQLVVKTREEAEGLRKRALAGEDFGELIKTHSEGLTAKVEGKVGFVRRESKMYPPELLKTLFRMSPGEYTPVVETQIGYSVIRVLERTDPERARKEFVEKNRDRLVQELEEELWEAEKEKLSRQHKVVINRKVVDAYFKARQKGAPVAALLGKQAFSVDGISFSLADVTDPTGMGVVHGTQTLDQMVRHRLDDFVIAREVEKRGLREKFPEIALKEKLLREHLLAREYINFRSRDLKVTESERRTLYEERKERFVLPRALDLSFIETKSQERVKTILDLLNTGTSFEEVADQWSDAKDAKGGRAGLIPENAIAPELAVVKTLKVGEYSRAAVRIRSRKGDRDVFVIPKLNGIREQGVIDYRDVPRGDLDAAIMARKREDMVKTIYAELRTGNKVEFSPAFDVFRKSYGKQRQHAHQGGTR